jgi:hypothetical protein
MKVKWVLGAKQGGFEQVWGHFWKMFAMENCGSREEFKLG